jgi:hypothetical protein
MCFILDWLVEFVEFSTRHPAIALVLVGVICEGIEIISKAFFEEWYKRHERTLDKIGAIFWIVVVIGLAFEIPESTTIDKQTSYNEVLVANIGTTNAQLVADNFILRSNVVALESQLKPRMLTMMQITNFIFLTEKIPKFPVRVDTLGMNDEAASYAWQIRQMLIQAHYDTPSSDINLPFGIHANPNFSLTMPNNRETNVWSDLQFNTDDSNVFKTFRTFHTLKSETNNGLIRVTIATDDTNNMYGAFINAFEQIGIIVSFANQTDWKSPSTIDIIVRQKP